MTLARIQFAVRGTPKAQPRARGRAIRSKKSGKYFAHIYNPKTADPWKSMVILTAHAHMPREPWTGPLSLTVDVFFERTPKWVAEKYAHVDGPVRHTEKPDRDNVDKAVMDALKTAGLYVDDRQVCDGPPRKWWCAKGCAPGVIITAEQLEEYDSLFTQPEIPS